MPLTVPSVQHFHMRSVLKRFETDEGIKVTHKADGRIEFLEADAPAFVGMRAWSQEAEATISAPIENKFIGEVNRLVSGGEVNNHRALSRYHLLWSLRHHYATNPGADTKVFDIDCGTLPQDAEEWLEACDKVPTRAGGVVPARFVTAQMLKADLAFPANLEIYEGVVWSVVRSPDVRLISADCYRDCLIMVVAPHLAFQGAYKTQPTNTLSASGAAELNARSVQSAINFTFG